jgi:hypothetical protein
MTARCPPELLQHPLQQEPAAGNVRGVGRKAATRGHTAQKE